MRAVIFACLLAIAGVSAMPQDIAPTQGRFIDLWVKNVVYRYRTFMKLHGYDPYEVPDHEFDSTLIPGELFIKGFLNNCTIVGMSELNINSVYYNIGMGRLDVDVVMPEISITMGEYQVEGRYGDRGGLAKLSGKGVVSNVRLVVDALLLFFPGVPVTVYNINADFSIASIEAEAKASWKCQGCEEERDVSSCVNNILNNRIVEIMENFRAEIGTMVGEGIRYIVNNRWW